jgi:hypothetical protein
MKDHILKIAMTHKNDLARTRAKRIMRLRYGMKFQPTVVRHDPVWLTAHD